MKTKFVRLPLCIPSPAVLLFKFTKSQIAVIFAQVVAQAHRIWKQESPNIKALLWKYIFMLND